MGGADNLLGVYAECLHHLNSTSGGVNSGGNHQKILHKNVVQKQRGNKCY